MTYRANTRPRLVSIAHLAAATCALAPALARADSQFVIVDQTYTATAGNTNDSHFKPVLESGLPSNWKSPVNYTAGRVHVWMKVIEKPSYVPTLMNICFEGNGYACMNYPPAYTDEGLIEFDQDLDTFWQYSSVAWQQGIDVVSLVLKDEDENKPQGDPDFYPTKIHIVITVVPAGETYQSPTDEPDPVSASSSQASSSAAATSTSGGGSSSDSAASSSADSSSSSYSVGSGEASSASGGEDPTSAGAGEPSGTTFAVTTGGFPTTSGGSNTGAGGAPPQAANPGTVPDKIVGHCAATVSSGGPWWGGALMALTAFAAAARRRRR